MFNRNRLYALITLLLVLSVGTYYVLTRNSTTEPEDDVFVLRNPPASKVFIKDLHNSEYDLSSKTQESVKTMLYDYIGRNDPGLYTGTIRKNSFSQATISNGYSTKKFLVDVEPPKLTYQIIISGKQDNTSIYILCAPQDKQLDKAATCEDSRHP